MNRQPNFKMGKKNFFSLNFSKLKNENILGLNCLKLELRMNSCQLQARLNRNFRGFQKEKGKL
jgi:hypothetical protein